MHDYDLGLPGSFGRLIARVYHRRGIIESWGRGRLKMVELMQQAGLPHPEIEAGSDFVLVRFRPSRYIPPQQVKQNLSDRQRLILYGFQPEIARPWLQTVEPKITCQSANALFLAGIRIIIVQRRFRFLAMAWTRGSKLSSQHSRPLWRVYRLTNFF